MEESPTNVFQMTSPKPARVPPMCKRCGVLIKGQEPDAWITSWWSRCEKCHAWSEHTFSERENLPDK